MSNSTLGLECLVRPLAWYAWYAHTVHVSFICYYSFFLDYLVVIVRFVTQSLYIVCDIIFRCLTTNELCTLCVQHNSEMKLILVVAHEMHEM